MRVSCMPMPKSCRRSPSKSSPTTATSPTPSHHARRTSSSPTCASTPRGELYGDIDGLAQTEAFGGNVGRAEAQVRGMQGLLICRALRQSGFQNPIILFASLAQNITDHLRLTLAPIHVIEGLILRDVKAVLEGIST